MKKLICLLVAAFVLASVSLVDAAGFSKHHHHGKKAGRHAAASHHKKGHHAKGHHHKHV